MDGLLRVTSILKYVKNIFHFVGIFHPLHGRCCVCLGRMPSLKCHVSAGELSAFAFSDKRATEADDENECFGAGLRRSACSSMVCRREMSGPALSFMPRSSILTTPHSRLLTSQRPFLFPRGHLAGTRTWHASDNGPPRVSVCARWTSTCWT